MKARPENITPQQLQAQVVLWQNQYKALQESFTKLSANHPRFQQEKQKLHDLHTTLELTYTSLHTSVENLEKEKTSLTAENARLEAEKANLEAQHRQIASEQKKLESENLDLKQQNGLMSFQIEQLKRLIYGSKRERFISNAAVNQMVLPFDTEETLTRPEEQPTEKIEYTRRKYTKAHPGRTKLPDHLPVKEIEIQPEEDTQGMKCIGSEVTDKLDLTPAKLTILRYIRYKYVAPEQEEQHQEAEDSTQRILIGQLPTFPIEKGIATAGLLAHIAVEKFVYHMPVYRQIQRFKQDQITLSASTIDGWITQTSRLLSPLYEHIKNKILNQGYTQVDETPIRVLDRNKKGKTHQGYYWVYNAPLLNAVFFDYRPGRGADGPRQLLKDFKGYLQTDGYNVYEWFGKQKGITLLGCMAHARRGFEKALDYDREKASQVMTLIQQLYDVERQAREEKLSPEERKELRLNEALPVANKLGKLMAEMHKTTLPKSPLSQALAYTIARWDKLLNYLYDGSLEIDNNLVENAIRPNALGRKNYLFAGSHEGAKRAAMFYTFFGICKKHDVNPWQWMKKVLEIIPEHKVTRLEELLPQNLNLDE